MQQQDASDPTGVNGGPPRQHNDPSPPALARARTRKSNAAVAMKLAGATWEEIALTLGYPTARQALVATERALEKQLSTDADRARMRQLAGLRLDRLLRSVWPKAIDPEHPEHLFALTKAREVIADHRRLYGLDAPTEVVVHSPTQAELERWVAQVISVGQPQLVEADIVEGDWEETDDAVQTGT